MPEQTAAVHRNLIFHFNDLTVLPFTWRSQRFKVAKPLDVKGGFAHYSSPQMAGETKPDLRLEIAHVLFIVSGITDVNDRSNIAGGGINIAQRVMDCGDAHHILLSKHVAEDLEQYGHWHR